MTYTILPELQTYLPEMQRGEAEGLREQIARDGCRDPIVLWRGTIVDGHHRAQICAELGIEPPIVDYSHKFTDIRAVKAWMTANLVGRRNVTVDQIAVICARDGHEPPTHVRVSASWESARKLVASAPAKLVDRVLQTPSYTIRMAANDFARETRVQAAKKRAKTKLAPVTSAKLRTDRGTPTRQGLALKRGVRDMLAHIVEQYLAHGHSPDDVVALIEQTAREIANEVSHV